MEDDVNMKDKKSDLKGFQKQAIDLDNKDSLQKVVEIIGKLADDDEVKKAKTINKSKAVKKIFKKMDNMKATKAELEKLKEIFYDDEDWEEEQDMIDIWMNEYDDKEYVNKKTGKPSKTIKKNSIEKQAAYVVLTNKRNQMASILNDKGALQKVRKFSKSLGGESCKKNNKNKKVIVINNKDDDIGSKEVPLEQIDQVLNELENDTDNKIIVENKKDENQNKIEEVDDGSNSEEETNFKKKKELADFFKQKKQDKFKKMFDIIEQTNLCFDNLKKTIDKMGAPFAKEVDLSKESDFFKKSWQAIESKSFRDTQTQIKNFMNACYIGANDNNSCDNFGAFLQITAITASLHANIQLISNAISAIYKFLESFNQQWVNMAKFGPNSRFKINQKIIRPQAKTKHKYSDEEWSKLSYYQKFSNTWNFTDSKQNVPKNWFISFSKKEKEEFLMKRAKWRCDRLVQLAERLKKKDKGVVNDIDRFMFYENRDGYGYWIPSKDFDSYNYSSDEITILNSFKKIVSEYSDKKLIYNKFRFGDKFLFCNGLSSERRLSNYKDNNYYNAQSFYNQYNNSNSQTTFTGKKRKNKNQGLYYRSFQSNNNKKSSSNFAQEE